ncbi:nitrate reductase cytochrome c-type subunit [Variovorax sp. HW608]|uniref:nitrate reductase cytochrome c-type subunit n=1 Tax=Variovorax sp. HW608 TaxID=1034889 RepID=UPI000B5AD297|nr:nitrate reductase cytochrome c-type subunit [Variovorax sp. HW608]
MKPSRSWTLPRTLWAMLLAACSVLFFAPPASSQGLVDPMRGPTPIPELTKPPPIFPTENKDIRRTRNFAMQPPTIPHTIDGYQVDKEFNRCMFCHARTQTQETGAIPVSITHYQDRNGNMLADVSPRRYFCTQCHVAQADAKPLIGNNFVDVEQLLKRKPGVLGSTK